MSEKSNGKEDWDTFIKSPNLRQRLNMAGKELASALEIQALIQERNREEIENDRLQIRVEEHRKIISDAVAANNNAAQNPTQVSTIHRLDGNCPALRFRTSAPIAALISRALKRVGVDPQNLESVWSSMCELAGEKPPPDGIIGYSDKKIKFKKTDRQESCYELYQFKKSWTQIVSRDPLKVLRRKTPTDAR